MRWGRRVTREERWSDEEAGEEDTFYDRNYDMFMLEQWSDEEAGEEEGRQGVEGGVMNRYPKRDQDKI